MSEIPYTVTYNGQSPWQSGVPYVSLDVEEVYVAGQIGTIRTVTLNGTIPSGGTKVITGIQNIFANNFKAFSAPNVSMPCAAVEQVSFDSQNYIGKVDYSITLRDFSGFLFGVNDPVDEVTYQGERDGSVTVNHRVAAVGVHTGMNAGAAFANACTFVRGRTGVSNVTLVGPLFVSSTNSGNMFVVSQQENINRAVGSYAITEVFKYDALRDTENGTFKRFTVDYGSGIGDDYIQVSVNGTYSVGKDVWDTGLYGRVAMTDFYNLAVAVASDVNPNPLSFALESESVSQTIGGVTGTRAINARAVYDNSPQGSFFDYDVEATKDFKRDVTQITIRGIIMGSGRHVRRKFDSALAFYNSTVGGWNGVPTYLYGALLTGVSDFGYTSRAFNPTPQNLTATLNSGQGLISMSATYDDAPFVSGYLEFGWDVSADCGMNVFKPHASANQNGFYNIQDLNILNRSSVSLNGRFGYQMTGAFIPYEAEAMLIRLKNLEGTTNAFLESESYNKNSGEMIRTGFNYVYSKEGKNLEVLPDDGRIRSQ